MNVRYMYSPFSVFAMEREIDVCAHTKVPYTACAHTLHRAATAGRSCSLCPQARKTSPAAAAIPFQPW